MEFNSLKEIKDCSLSHCSIKPINPIRKSPHVLQHVTFFLMCLEFFDSLYSNKLLSLSSPDMNIVLYLLVSGLQPVRPDWTKQTAEPASQSEQRDH